MGKVIMYSVPGCPFCGLVKNHLNQRRVPYDDVDVSISHHGLWEMMEKSGQTGVPVIIVENESEETVLTGYDPGDLDDALDPFNRKNVIR
jgi:glutaredoxin 3